MRRRGWRLSGPDAFWQLPQPQSIISGSLKGLRCFVPRFAAGRHGKHRIGELAFLQAESSYTLPSLVTAQLGQLPQGSSAILITPMIWPELLLAVDSLQRRNLRPVVVLLMAQSFGSSASNEDLSQSLMQRNVPVCRIYCEADLSETLSTFAAANLSKDVSWRQPVLSHLT